MLQEQAPIIEQIRAFPGTFMMIEWFTGTTRQRRSEELRGMAGPITGVTRKNRKNPEPIARKMIVNYPCPG
jgi:hypothetical protein